MTARRPKPAICCAHCHADLSSELAKWRERDERRGEERVLRWLTREMYDMNSPRWYRKARRARGGRRGG